MGNLPLTHGNEDMAANFRVRTKEINKQSTALRLFGDFDASSAYELINAIDQSARTSSKVAIDTDGLKSINAFGVEVFLLKMSKLNNIRAKIEVTGQFSDKFNE
jgi:stage II sporulation protein AA (anti-sigma F factor antagonist)